MDWPMGSESDGLQEASMRLAADLLSFAAIVVAMLVLLSLTLLFIQPMRRRHFYCALSGREVEVEFEERGLPGMRRTVAVRSCTVFEPPQAVRCKRRCLDEDLRQFWQAWTPIPLGRK
ncbi:MAG TPA: hypothetical protein VFN71_06315 [Methylomirabilota bacterium]|nr:hypothetical protein [Methylomirabilota bacterium]